MTKYTIYSKSKSGKYWMIERSYTLKSYADHVVKGIKKRGRLAKIIKKK